MPARHESLGEEVTPVTEITGRIHKRIGNLCGEAIGIAGSTASIAGYVATRTGAEIVEIGRKIRRGVQRKPYTD